MIEQIEQGKNKQTSNQTNKKKHKKTREMAATQDGYDSIHRGLNSLENWRIALH